MDTFEALKFCPNCGNSSWEDKTPDFRVCRQCSYEWYKVPHPGAAGLVFDAEGRLMLLRRSRNPAKGKLGFPGGFCNIKESAEQAVAREVWEETKIKVEIEKFLFSLPNLYEYRGVELYPLDLFFKCRIIDNSHFEIDTSENSEIVFLKPEQIKLDDIGLPSHREVLKRLFGLTA